MSHLLWKFYLEDDVESFCQLLEESGTSARPSTQRFTPSGQSALKIGSPGAVGSSPAAFGRSFEDAYSASPAGRARGDFADVVLSRADVNRKDGKGMTLLHHAASSINENAMGFALALVAHPLIDLYPQDLENGWTALHRCFYFGNITIARAILEREAQNAVGEGQVGILLRATSLIKMKDHEGNGPFDVVTATIQDRTLHHQDMDALFNSQNLDAADDEELEDEGTERSREAQVKPSVDLLGDELFTFGSNKNFTLGLGNEDDRQFPERVHLRRPKHLYRRFVREHFEQRAARSTVAGSIYADNIRASARIKIEAGTVPSVVRSKPILVQDVQMSKFHTAVLTDDPICNLYLCGHGPGGRLGTGDEKTRFSFVCVEDFLSARKKIVAVALGQDHTLAVTEQGELFTWGSNAFGQLGSGMSRTSLNAEEPNQLVPKQLFGTLKREAIIGVAASRIHSVAHTANALYTFGKNEGQLGIVDAHARTLEIQPVPRRVAATRFSCGIQSVSAIDRATICLLENHEVRVFANYGDVKLQFPLDGFTNHFLKDNFRSTRYDERPNTIVKVTGGGDTVCALSSSGEVYSVNVDQRIDPSSSNTGSTTNPNKIRSALSTPARVWTLKKGHMNARDVGVDQDGSIILTTEAGSVWRRVRRTNLPGASKKVTGERRKKEFKFMRVPNLTRVIAVRASAFGAYCAVRRDCDVTRTQIVVNRRTLLDEFGALLPFKNIESLEENNSANPTSSFWTRPSSLQKIVASMAGSKDLEKDVDHILRQSPNNYGTNYDAIVRTTVSEIGIPAHTFALAGRSRVLREATGACRRGGVWENEFLSVMTDEQGKMVFKFKGIDFLTLAELILYLYTDSFIGFWVRSKDALHLAHRFRQVRVELMKTASRLELRELESAVRRVAASAPATMNIDMELAFADFDYLQSGDTVLQLKDGEMLVHSDLLSRRCPFFESLFQGRAGGRWLADRREHRSDPTEAVDIDFTHVECSTFRLVLRHIYADTGEELFDNIVARDLDDFIDIILDVLSVANELMLDRLCQICQMVLGRHVNVRTVCGLLNAVAPSAVPEFKNSALEYICLNLEAMLTTQLLDELDEDLLNELDGVVRGNQLDTLPYVKSGRMEGLLLEKYPELAERIDRDRQAKLDALRVRVKYADLQGAFGTSLHEDEDEIFGQRTRQRHRLPSQTLSPRIAALGPASPQLSGIAGKGKSPALSPLFGPSVPARKSPASPQADETSSFPPGSLWALPDIGPSALAEQIRTFSIAAPPNATDLESLQSARRWGNTPMTPAKLGMKEIMDQASAASRSSGISMGLASQAATEASPSSSWNSRMSQKERRRLQQQQRERTEISPENASEDAIPSSPTPSSPWQTVPKAKSSVITDSLNANASPQPKRPVAKRSLTPQLTMRQTIANVSTGKRKDSQLEDPHTPASPQMSSSPHAASLSPASSPATSRPTPSNNTSNSASNPVEIQSIRHTPRPNAQISPSFYMHQSMADILSQQEAEKTSVKEAVAKRSLQEIQQEQEFLDWFETESRRVIEAEAAEFASARAASTASTRGGRGVGRGGPRSGRNRGRRGRGGDGGQGNVAG